MTVVVTVKMTNSFTNIVTNLTYFFRNVNSGVSQNFFSTILILAINQNEMQTFLN